MNLKQFYLILLSFGLLTFMSGCAEKDTSYKAQVKRHRFEKDKHFKYADKSPLTDKQQMGFRSLDYFPVHKAYRLTANVERIANPDTVSMAYTNGEKKQYSKFAKLNFELQDKEHTIFAYRNLETNKKEANQVFIPFYDRTNEHSTYGGGRYLDIESFGEGDTTILDFNKAYNPYCAYNEEFACPIPPDENRLDAIVKAGEKQFDN